MAAPIKPKKPKPCPECGTPMDGVVTDPLLHQTHGILYRCPECGAEVDASA